jgi:hypothetical protein
VGVVGRRGRTGYHEWSESLHDVENKGEVSSWYHGCRESDEFMGQAEAGGPFEG